MRLASGVWVAALIRRAALEGGFAGVVRRGDPDAGAVFVKSVDLRLRTTRLYAEALGPDGAAVWIEPKPGAPDAELDAWLARRVAIDPDAWIVEIEDAHGRHFLTEPVNAA